MSEKYSQTCEACLPFKTTDDFKNYIERRDLEEQLAKLIRENSAIALIGLGGTGKTTLLNKVLRELDEYERIDVFSESTDFSFFRIPQEVISNFLRIVEDAISRKSSAGGQSTEAIELATSLEISSHSISSAQSKEILEAVRESEKFDYYVRRIRALLESQSKTFIVVLDDLVDLMDKNVRRSLIILVKALNQSLGSNKIKFLVVARETKTLGRELLLGKEEILELEDNFACIRIGGFDTLQTEKFLKHVMHFSVENRNVIDALYRKTQGRPRVLCYALTSFRRKYGLSYISLQDARNEDKFPSTPKQQLNNYINEVYEKYKIELIAASVLQNFTKDDLIFLCSKIGKEITEVDFLSFRNSEYLKETEEGGFVLIDIYKPLMVDIYESLLNDDERYRYNRFMVYYYKEKVSARNDQAVVFHVNQIIIDAPTPEKEELLRAKMESGDRLSAVALNYNLFTTTIYYGSEAYSAAVELKAQERILSLIFRILRAALNARSGSHLVEDYFKKATEQYATMVKKDDYQKCQLSGIIYSYALYYCDVKNQYTEALGILEKAQALVDEIEDKKYRLEVLADVCDAQTRIHLQLGDANAATKALQLFKDTIEEQKNSNFLGDPAYYDNMSLVEHRAAEISRMEGDLEGALTHARKSLDYDKKQTENTAIAELFLARYLLMAGKTQEAIDYLKWAVRGAWHLSPMHDFVTRTDLVFAYLIQGEIKKAVYLVNFLDDCINNLPALAGLYKFIVAKTLLSLKMMHEHEESEKEKGQFSLEELTDLRELLERHEELRKSLGACRPEITATILFLDYATERKNKDDLIAQIGGLKTPDKTALGILKELESSISRDDFEKAIKDLARLSP